MAAPERRGIDRRAPRRDPRARRRRAAVARARGVDAGAGVAHGRDGNPGRRRRPARRRARRVRARGARRDVARDGTGAGGGAGAARAHRRRALGLDVARDEGRGDVRRVPNIRLARQNHPCIVLYLQRHERSCDTCKVAGGVGRRAPRVPRLPRRSLAVEAGQAARGRRPTSSGRCATSSGPGRRATLAART